MTAGLAGRDVVKFAIYAEDAGHFIEDTKHDLVWILRAAHHFPGKELTGDEELPSNDTGLQPRVSECLHRIQEQVGSSEWQPKPSTGPEYFKHVYVVKADRGGQAEACFAVLAKLPDVCFSRGGRIEVIRVPQTPWCRKSRQDEDVCDAWTWGTLMPLYFKEIGEREEQWMVPFFQTQFTRRGFVIKSRADAALLSQHWNIFDSKLFARHVAVVLVHPVTAERVRILTVFQPSRPPKKGGVWALPGGNVDRGKDSTWKEAAWREFDEEVNPNGTELWSAYNASDGRSALISLQNLLPCVGEPLQNMSRPCLNFVLARANMAFVEFTRHVEEHPQGGRKLELPSDYVTQLAHLVKEHPPRGDLRRYWTDTSVPFVEHDRFEWVELDLVSGVPTGISPKKLHNYIPMLAKALQSGAPPRRELCDIVAILAPGASNSSITALANLESACSPHDVIPSDPLGAARDSAARAHEPQLDVEQLSYGVYKVYAEKQLNVLFAQGSISFADMRQAKHALKGSRGEPVEVRVSSDRS